jgi:D-glycero-beta-D-manno-heptose-7-phosphate kinase
VSPARYREILARFTRVRATVVGDLIADEFIFGKLDRVSREAPVLILGYDSTEVVPGGAGNAAANAAALGARVRVCGLVGRDAPGTRLLSALAEVADVSGVVRSPAFVTPVKTRILAGGTHSAKQQVVRIDRAGGRITPALSRRVEGALVSALKQSDVVIISDYGSGMTTPAMWQRAMAGAGKRAAPLILVDSRYALEGFTGATAATPNESEVEAWLGRPIGDDMAVLETAGRRLLDVLGARAVLVTRGSKGMALFERGKATDHIPIVGSDQVTDVTGAGDTVIAAFSLALAAGASFAEAARLANVAGGVVVMKRGTATVTGAEIDAALSTPHTRRSRAAR